MLEAAAGRGRQQPLDPALTLLGLAAEAELAVDDRAAQRALGVVVGRLHAAAVGEGPQRRPGLERVARQPARVLVARRLARVAAQDRLELTAQQPNAATELAPLAGVLVDLPGPEQLRADPKARLSELALGGE